MELFSWQTYVGAGVGGIIGGIAAPLAPLIGPLVIGAISSGSMNIVGQSLENFTGGEKRSFGEILLNTGVSTALGVALIKLPIIKIKGINAGRNSMRAVFKSGITKIDRGTALKMSSSVKIKGFIKQSYEALGADYIIGGKQYIEKKYEKQISLLKNFMFNDFPSTAKQSI